MFQQKISVFQSGVISFIVALKTTSEELEALKKMFLALDTSKDGQLSLDEIKEGLDKILGSVKGSDKDYISLMNSLDKDGNGFVDYTEFITGAINIATILNIENLTAAFKLLDADNSGFIDLDELKQAFDSNNAKDADIFLQIMNEADLNKDGKISFEEFKTVMIKLVKKNTKAKVFKE